MQQFWTQFLVGTLIVGVIVFLGTQLWEMQGTLSSVETKIDETDERVTRIAGALPSLRVQIAQEEVHNAISGFVALSEPRLNQDSLWVTKAAVYNRDSEKMRVYRVALDESHRDFVTYVVAGKVKASATENASFSVLAAYSAAIRKPVTVPTSLDADASFVLRSADAEELDKFLSGLTEERAKTVELGKIRNWAELSTNLDSIAETTQPQ